MYATEDSEYVVHEKELYAKRKIKVVCIGAGLSGILLAIRLPVMTENVELVVYDKNPKVGGTWYENHYPGARCDVPSHLYQYSFEPNPYWSEFYSPAGEIQRYLQNVAAKYDAMKYIRLRTKVTGALWNEDVGKWKLKVIPDGGSEFDDECDILINAMGFLNNWRFPDIPGLKTYQGNLLHPANWDDSTDLTDKNIAVIGNGSSAIQIVTAVTPIVKHLDSYTRSTTWIISDLGQEDMDRIPDGQFIYKYSAEQMERFSEDPDYYLQYVHKLDNATSTTGLMRMFLRDHPAQAKILSETKADMAHKLSKKPELVERLIPSWPVGCRRITPGPGYLEALVEDKVDSIFGEIANFDATGITMKDGNHRTYDAIICATGFDVSYRARFPLVGRNGAQLDDKYAQSPYSYLGIGVPGFPNYFCFYGPNSPVGVGSLLPPVEAQTGYIINAIIKFQTQDIKSMMPTFAATRRFVEHTDKWMPRAVWSAGCRSWYKNHTTDARVSALWPGTNWHYADVLAQPRWEDYEYTYMDSNPFSYLGDGFTHIEHTGGDRTWDLGIRTNSMKDHPALKSLHTTVQLNDTQ